MGSAFPAEIDLTDVRSGSRLILELISTQCPTDRLHMILLRHFAWLPWRHHVMEIEENKGLFFGGVESIKEKSSKCLKHYCFWKGDTFIVFQAASKQPLKPYLQKP